MFVNHAHVMPASTREDGTVDSLARLMDQLGFEGAVCFAPFTYQMGDLGDQNDWLAGQIKGRPEFVGFGTLAPTVPPHDQVRRVAGLGFRGIKLHPGAQGFELTGPWAMAAYEEMAEIGLIADFHTGIHWHRLRDYRVIDHDEISARVPSLRMVFEHVGGWHFNREMLAVISNGARHGNHLYAGIASVLNDQAQRYWYLGPEGLENCRWQVGEDLLIYGLDFPYNQEREIANDLRIIRELNWPAETVDKLLGRNLKRLLGLEPGEAKQVGGDPNPTGS
jgi:predicted TIM-barrel fold metal-dependent hydrolase